MPYRLFSYLYPVHCEQAFTHYYFSALQEAGGNSVAAGAENTGESSGPDETAQNEGDVSVSKTEEAGGGGGDGKSGDGYEDPFAGL